MRSVVLAAACTVTLAGCAGGTYWTPPAGQPIATGYQNPIFVPGSDPQCVWPGVVEVVEDYFKIQREKPVQVAGQVITEGRIDTFPKIGATLLEPWDHDSANAYERLESTLQTIRRRAIVRVVPAQGGYWVDVAVFKELEDLPQPAMSTAGAAIFRYDSSLNRVINPDVAGPVTKGWIPQGRDAALEQRMLGQLQERFHVASAVPGGWAAPRGW
jgi:hypothetical protein